MLLKSLSIIYIIITSVMNYDSEQQVLQGDHSPDNIKCPDNSLTVRGTPLQHSAC